MLPPNDLPQEEPSSHSNKETPSQDTPSPTTTSSTPPSPSNPQIHASRPIRTTSVLVIFVSIMLVFLFFQETSQHLTWPWSKL